MPTHDLKMRIENKDAERNFDLSVREAIIAGWTSRDREATEVHIRELEELGVKRPSSTPMFYQVAARRLTTDSEIEVTGEHSSGEVEFVIVSAENELWIGAGSDHTDRKVESYGVTVSKQMCEKPIAPILWRYADVAGHWDRLQLRSYIFVDGKRTLYQEGSVSAMLPPEQLIDIYLKRESGNARTLSAGSVMFCGTLPAHGGIRCSDRFEFELEDPVLRRSIAHCYDVKQLPVRE